MTMSHTVRIIFDNEGSNWDEVVIEEESTEESSEESVDVVESSTGSETTGSSDSVTQLNTAH